MTRIDPNIIDLCKKGDERAFTEVYTLYYSFLLSVTKRYISDHEEAVFQMNTGFAQAMCNVKKYSAERPFGAWIRRVVVNSVIDHLRKKKRYQEHLNNYQQNVVQLSAETSSVNYGVEKLDYEDVLELLEVLPKGTRSVFNLFVLDGYKYDEISALLDIPVGTCKWHISKGRKLLMDKINSSSEYQRLYNNSSAEKKQLL